MSSFAAVSLADIPVSQSKPTRAAACEYALLYKVHMLRTTSDAAGDPECAVLSLRASVRRHRRGSVASGPALRRQSTTDHSQVQHDNRLTCAALDSVIVGLALRFLGSGIIGLVGLIPVHLLRKVQRTRASSLPSS